jgi:hypothetical protein
VLAFTRRLHALLTILGSCEEHDEEEVEGDEEGKEDAK